MKIGILGGGQLGKMIFLAGTPLHLDMHFMDKTPNCPVGHHTPKFNSGDFTSYEDVFAFGKNMDVVTIEIEKVNVDALFELEKMGVLVYPNPSTIQMIQDKGLQKEFYSDHDIPTSRFQIYSDLHEFEKDLSNGIWELPVIQKIRKDGYDGRGVKTIQSPTDFNAAFGRDFLIEEKVDIVQEIAVIICRSAIGEVRLYDPVEMVFDPHNHILEYQIGPANISSEQLLESREIATRMAEKIELVGLLAIEFFIDKEGNVLVNEVAPRPHNSGHHTIEACPCSQYENLLRAVQGWPLGDTKTSSPSLLYNLLGADGYQGPPEYHGLNKILAIENVHIHIYGKDQTKPNRKMGHITVLAHERNTLVQKFEQIRQGIKVIS